MTPTLVQLLAELQAEPLSHEEEAELAEGLATIRARQRVRRAMAEDRYRPRREVARAIGVGLDAIRKWEERLPAFRALGRRADGSAPAPDEKDLFYRTSEVKQWKTKHFRAGA